jgi:hypothetical protein
LSKRAADKENITFRLEKTTLEKIGFEAEQKGVSMNTIAHSIFSDYFNWNGCAPKAGMIPMHKTVLSMIFDKLSEKEVIEVAEFFAKVKVKDMLLVLRNSYNLESFLDTFEAWLKSSSLSYTRNVNHDTQMYTITHEMGNKWSIYMWHMLKTVFQNIGLGNVVFEKSDDIITFKIPLIILQHL